MLLFWGHGCCHPCSIVFCHARRCLLAQNGLELRIDLGGQNAFFGMPDSGFLTAREIYDVNLRNTSLVTISACESGLGRIARGDEIMGLSRSFFSAGADGLVMSLWPVADDSTELLMTTFYGELSRGSELIDALQKAQLSVMRHKGFAQPFFWAPFSASGNWRLKLNV